MYYILIYISSKGLTLLAFTQERGVNWNYIAHEHWPQNTVWLSLLE